MLEERKKTCFTSQSFEKNFDEPGDGLHISTCKLENKCVFIWKFEITKIPNNFENHLYDQKNFNQSCIDCCGGTIEKPLD